MNNLILFIISIIAVFQLQADTAVVIVPVADLFGQPKASSFPYDAQPSSGCSRLAQLLFNEVVEIIKTVDDEVCIEVKHFFHTTQQQPQKKITRYWTKKNNLLTLTDLSKLFQNSIPTPLDFNNPATAEPNDTIITLQQPWYHKKTDTTYSAGTRFVVLDVHKNNYLVPVIHAPYTEPIIGNVPKKLCVPMPKNSSRSTKRAHFVDLVRAWTPITNECIPYVLGGSSCTRHINRNSLRRVPESSTASHIVSHPAQPPEGPLTGFDCSGVIMRAAQSCGIPYFFKNSTTIATHLPAVTSLADLAVGDIIAIPGHVMIVADLNNNSLLESRSWYHGFGYVQELRLEQEFAGIKTYADLIEASNKKIPIARLNAQGNTIQMINAIQVLSLNGVYTTNK